MQFATVGHKLLVLKPARVEALLIRRSPASPNGRQAGSQTVFDPELRADQRRVLAERVHWALKERRRMPVVNSWWSCQVPERTTGSH